MDKVNTFLAGKKTYITAAMIVATAAFGFLNGDASLGDAVQQVLAGLGLATLRAGVAKAGS